MTEVELFVSTQRIKVLTADTQVSQEEEHPPGFGVLKPPCWDLCFTPVPVACGRGDASLHGRPTQTCRVPEPSAWPHEASRAHGAWRLLLGSQSRLQGAQA